MKFMIALFINLSVFGMFIPAAGAADEHPDLKKEEIVQYSLPYLFPFVDEDRLKLLMDSLEKRLYQPPVDAIYNDDEEMIKAKAGAALNREKFQLLFRDNFYSGKNKSMEIPVKPIHPRVDSGLLKEISARKIGNYTTHYRESNQERSHNIALATEEIDNAVIFPGETFSFNEVVGERTAEKGYQQAPVIIRGELSEDIGGGICQLSSTLFNAVDMEGVQIVERYTHSKSVPYVPPGRDATISWWGPDFVFKNLYNAPLLIRAKSKNGEMTVSVYTSEQSEYFTGKDRMRLQ